MSQMLLAVKSVFVLNEDHCIKVRQTAVCKMLPGQQEAPEISRAFLLL